MYFLSDTLGKIYYNFMLLKIQNDK